MKRLLLAVALLCACANSLSAAGDSKAFDFRPATPAKSSSDVLAVNAGYSAMVSADQKPVVLSAGEGR